MASPPTASRHPNNQPPRTKNVAPYANDKAPSPARTKRLITRSEHRRNDAVRRFVAIGEGLDVDDDLLAHVDAAFECARTHVRQQHDVGQLLQLRIDRRLMLEHV